MNTLENVIPVEDFSGDREKDGVVIKCNSGFNYYQNMSDNSLTPIEVKKAMTRSKTGLSKVKTSKVFEPVTVANNEVTVTVYPNGKIEITPNPKV